MASPGVPVWPVWVRLVHWTVAVLIVVDLLNEAGANPWHRYLGYAAAALVLLRLLAGLAAQGAANLAGMLRSTRRAFSYARELGGGRARPVLGHNPLGALMSFTMWVLVLFLGVTGWMSQLDAFWGEDWVHDVHAIAAYVLGACAVVHVAGVLFTSRVYRTNLVRSMITGRKNLPDARDSSGNEIHSRALTR